MTELSAPWTNNAIGDAAASPYSSDEWAIIWRELLRASKADSGPLLGSGTSPDPGLTVQATTPVSAAVQVTLGAALVRGTWYHSTATVPLAIAANGSANARYDLVVLRKDWALQTVRLAILQGTPAVSPSLPALTQTDGVTWEIPLGYIYVRAGFATIPAGDVYDLRSWANAADAVYVENVKNGTAFPLTNNEVVAWDLTADRTVKWPSGAGAIGEKVAGVWSGNTPVGGYGRVLTHGIGRVRTNGAVAARGLTLVASGASTFAVAAATAATASKRNGIGESLEILAGAGDCLCMVDVSKQRPGAITFNNVSGAGSTTSNAWADVNANAQISITPHTDRVKITAMIGGSITVAGDVAYYDIYSVELAARAGNAVWGLGGFQDSAHVGDRHPVTIVAIFTGLTPGIAQTFKLQHRLETGAGAAQLDTSAYLSLYAEELA